MPNGYSSLGGQVLNAHDLGDPSGSSAGSGVASSMALATGAIGTETSGSILSPSEANGVVGVKPTLGLASTAGIIPLAPSFDVPGPMMRSVTDAALVLGAIAEGSQAGDYTTGLETDALAGKRLAYSDDAYDSLGDDERALFDAAIARLERLGATVVPVQALDAQYVGITEIAAIPNEFKASLNRYLAEETPTAPHKTLSEIIAYNRTRPDRVKYGQNLLEASDLTPGREELFPLQAEPARQSAKADIDAALLEGDADAIITPGNRHANVGAAAGYPTVMVPLGYTEDDEGAIEPQGIGFLGPAFSEARLLAFAYAYEQAAPERVPPTKLNDALAPGRCERSKRPRHARSRRSAR
jgi:amidase